MTWKELKEFCNALPEKELKKNVIMWREDESVVNIEAMALSEDHYVYLESEEYGCFPESEAKQIIKNDDMYIESMDGFKKVYDKGHPILWDNFTI